MPESHLRLVPMLRMPGTVLPFLHTSSWRASGITSGTTFPLAFLFLRSCLRVFFCLLVVYEVESFFFLFLNCKAGVGRDSSVGIATRYGLDGPAIESR